MGPDTPHEEVFGRIPPQGGPQAERVETAEGKGQRLGLPPTGGYYGGDGISGSGDLRLLPPEHSPTVYCNQANYGPVSGISSETGAKVGN